MDSRAITTNDLRGYYDDVVLRLWQEGKARCVPSYMDYNRMASFSEWIGKQYSTCKGMNLIESTFRRDLKEKMSSSLAERTFFKTMEELYATMLKDAHVRSLTFWFVAHMLFTFRIASRGIEVRRACREFVPFRPNVPIQTTPARRWSFSKWTIRRENKTMYQNYVGPNDPSGVPQFERGNMVETTPDAIREDYIYGGATCATHYLNQSDPVKPQSDLWVIDRWYSTDTPLKREELKSVEFALQWADTPTVTLLGTDNLPPIDGHLVTRYAYRVQSANGTEHFTEVMIVKTSVEMNWDGKELHLRSYITFEHKSVEFRRPYETRSNEPLPRWYNELLTLNTTKVDLDRRTLSEIIVGWPDLEMPTPHCSHQEGGKLCKSPIAYVYKDSKGEWQGVCKAHGLEDDWEKM